jgi:acetylornithine deacetylase/succinyl-diaminopimelate desuccinylase-like protein
MATEAAVLAAVDQELEGSIARWIELLKIPSISTDPAYTGDCRKAGQWLVSALKAMGFAASLRDTPGHPMVVAHYRARQRRPGVPHVLFYGHYDVQPADPVEKWQTPPFEPVRRRDKDGKERVYARGAADDKGQLLTFVEASRAWLAATGDLPLDVTLLFEGEEESGSPSLVAFLKANRKELAHDVALVCDTNMWDPRTPAITTRLRGLLHDEVTITGPAIDLHSGLYGGAAMNPIRVLARIIADLHDKTGRIAIAGFYDGVKDLPRATREQWAGLKFSEKKFLAAVGLREKAGEAKRSLLEQIWSRPTAEVNGIIAGYTGAGTKTVIPSKASAKFSFRLVAGQDPIRLRRAFRGFVRARLPAGVRAGFHPAGGASPASEIAEDNPFLISAGRALKAEFGRAPVMMGCGGSIPIVRSFKDILGMESLLVGFGLNDDAIHSPNEKYDVASFHRGIRSWARMMAALAGPPA